MIQEVLEPQHELLQRFVDSIYILNRGLKGLEFTAYPSVNTPVALLRNAMVTVSEDIITINLSEHPNQLAIACNQFSSSAHIQYLQPVDEIAINFKPLGFSSFTGAKQGQNKIASFREWDGGVDLEKLTVGAAE